LRKFHTVLATFMFPVAMMFFITGTLYTLGVEGTFGQRNYEVRLPEHFQPGMANVKSLLVQQLHARHIDLPTGNARFREDKQQIRLVWGGAHISASLQYRPGSLRAKLNVYTADWYQRFARLHSAEGWSGFKGYAVAMASALMLLVLSGFIMAWQSRPQRKLAAISSICGLLFFILLYVVS